MSEEKDMPKRGRKPSPTLWRRVRGLSEEDWRQVKAFLAVYGKNSLQFKLIDLMRPMEVYDPSVEKAALQGHDVSSIKYSAKWSLVRSARKLALYQTETSQRVMDVDVALRWGVDDETMEWIAETKEMAWKEEEYEWLSLLMSYLPEAIKQYYQGEERSQKLREAAIEAKEVAKLLQLKAEIDLMVATHLEGGRNSLLESGEYDKQIAKDYFRGKFHRQRTDKWPLSFQFEKLRIDEALHYYLGDSGAAAKSAEKLLAVTRQLEGIRMRQTEDQSRIMFRLSAYYTDIRDASKVMVIVEEFRALLATESQFRMNYLRRAIISLFHAGFEFGKPELARDAFRIWEENEDELANMPSDMLGIRALYLLCAYQIATAEMAQAKRIYTRISALEPITTDMPLLVIVRIVHLILLLEEGDERGLESHGRNYKRYLEKRLPTPAASAGLEIVKVLTKPSNLEGGAKLREAMNLLVTRLEHFHRSDETTFKPFVYPLLMWAELRLGS